MSAARAPIPVFVIAAVALAVLCGAWIPLEPLPIESALTAIMKEPGGALMGHALIGLTVFAGLIALAVKKRVMPLPQVRFLIPLALLELCLLASLLFSEYRHLTLAGIFEWLGYGGALVLTVATVGRGNGIRLSMAAIAGSNALMALYGLKEWTDSAAAGNPSWRIFAHTMNPNVAAAFFVVGAMCGLGLISSKERLNNVVAGFAVFFCLVALLLTGSRGGLIAFLAAGGFYAIWMLALNRKLGLTALVTFIAIFAVAAGITTAMQKRYAGQVAGSRLLQGGESQAQSSGFRKLLYVGTVKLIGERPQGYGLGTYRFYSAKPGITTQTQLAHNGYLQLAMEASPVALIAFLTFIVMVAWQAFKGTRAQPSVTQMQKAAVAAAIGGLLIHAAFDSDFQVFGLGALLFVMCGLVLQMSNDTSAPEFLHPGMRNGIIAASVVVPIAMFYFGIVDLKHGLFLGSGQRDRDAIQKELNGLTSLAPLDSRIWFTRYRYLSALGAGKVDQGEALKNAIRLGPTLPMLRSMARFAQENESYGSPDYYLDRVLNLDPNNLLALEQKLQAAIPADSARAKEIAQRMVEIEQTNYFQIRSLPEIVPLETYKGRAYLASGLRGEAKAEMLLPAVKGFGEYAKVTTPKAVEFAKAGMDGGFGGVTLADVKQNLEFGRQLMSDYSAVRSDDTVSSALAAVDMALASLSQ